MKDLNYFDCPYAEKDDEEVLERPWHDYPCYHPKNAERKCQIRNKKEDQKALCVLID